jgi:hypothetical protein
MTRVTNSQLRAFRELNLRAGDCVSAAIASIALGEPLPEQLVAESTADRMRVATFTAATAREWVAEQLAAGVAP